MLNGLWKLLTRYGHRIEYAITKLITDSCEPLSSELFRKHGLERRRGGCAALPSTSPSAWLVCWSVACLEIGLGLVITGVLLARCPTPAEPGNQAPGNPGTGGWVNLNTSRSDRVLVQQRG